ncbi:MAG: polysaccharide lyase family protein [Planctomycetia bacterium]|nr:polysaccharide lyase family protein [Planctomycetia bacterium]
MNTPIRFLLRSLILHTVCITYFILFFYFFISIPFVQAEESKDPQDESKIVFQIGRPDARSAEFGGINWSKMREEKNFSPITFKVGNDSWSKWPVIHLSTRDFRNAGVSFTSTIEFDADKTYTEPLWLVVGVCFSHATEPSQINITINGKKLAPERAPTSTREEFKRKFNAAKDTGTMMSTAIPIPPNSVKEGKNVFTIMLNDGSWIFYDYLVLKNSPDPMKMQPASLLMDQFRKNGMKGIKEIVFVVRKLSTDPHWYANFGYYAQDENTFPFPLGSGARICAYDLDTGKVRTIIQTKTGSLRDPQIHYDGKKMIFSMLPDGKRHFNLYEINLDGTGLKQITSGDWDDIEPCYLPNNDIIFCSSRCKRWVQCWLTPVATLHRCGPNGENIHEVSSNIEHDNTPWVLPNGQILYMRWEYVDRSQVHYHHLWTMNPDGTRQMVYFGNLHPGILMIDAKPIPGSDKTVVVFSPGHGRKDHMGAITVVNPRNGPDDEDNAKKISNHSAHKDPWAFSETEFLTTRKGALQLLDEHGTEYSFYSLSDEEIKEEFDIHEPRPVQAHAREMIIPEGGDPTKTTGNLLLMNIYQGRKMKNIKPGTIKELLVLETLPEPIHYQGGMDQISSGGTFTLQRILGTVPVRPDGSAYIELPANRPVFFVAFDHQGKPVKRMHSFTSVMPGETTSCIGCHESRTESPGNDFKNKLFELTTKGAVAPRPITDIPDIFDFPRDIQPILDKYCVECHQYTRKDGGVDLSGDWSLQRTMSYQTLSKRALLGDNRNRPQSDFEPYEIGSSASRLYQLIEEGHEGVKMPDHEKKMIRYWLNSGANYAGTYAANGNGILWSYHNTAILADREWKESLAMKDAVSRRCDGCHNPRKRYLPHRLTGGGTYDISTLFNLTHPSKSRIVRAPLALSAGGLGVCRTKDKQPIFKDTSDPDYKTILAALEKGKHYLTYEDQRFSVKQPIVPCRPYAREMVRFGILPHDYDYKTPIDVYETDRKYFESFWYKPPQKKKISD